MAIKPLARWSFAAAQGATAFALTHWAQLDYNRFPISDRWAWPSALLIVFDLPAVFLGALMSLALRLPDAAGSVFVALVTFYFWAWAGEAIVNVKPARRLSSQGRMRTGIVAALAAFFLSPLTIAIAVRAGASLYWSSVTVLLCRAKFPPTSQ